MYFYRCNKGPRRWIYGDTSCEWLFALKERVFCRFDTTSPIKISFMTLRLFPSAEDPIFIFSTDYPSERSKGGSLKIYFSIQRSNANCSNRLISRYSFVRNSLHLSTRQRRWQKGGESTVVGGGDHEEEVETRDDGEEGRIRLSTDIEKCAKSRKSSLLCSRSPYPLLFFFPVSSHSTREPRR